MGHIIRIPHHGPLNYWNFQILFEKIVHEVRFIVLNFPRGITKKKKKDHFSSVCIFIL